MGINNILQLNDDVISSIISFVSDVPFEEGDGKEIIDRFQS
jgi:hypothetical protein